MSREEIIKLALEAGCIGPDEGGDPNGLWEPKGHENVTELMMKFAALVAGAEREACAAVCSDLAMHRDVGAYGMLVAHSCANEILARG